MGRKDNAKELAAGYTKTKRAVEITSLLICFVLWMTALVRTARWYAHSKEASLSHIFLYLPMSLLGGALTADFVSGVAHWALDTWGSTATPVFGFLIRSFREHHVDQTSITRHDFIETNGDNTLPINPVLLMMAFVPVTETTVPYHTFLVSLTLLVAFTNQCHKWAHEVRPHPWAKLAMEYHLILSPQNHRLHHKGEHDFHYCITTGWLNPFLDRINFWRKAEAAITYLTGAIPRANDLSLLKE
jgi:plasmanylethanolamine desaturase